MVLAIDGQGSLMQSFPTVLFAFNSFPFSSISTGSMPGKGFVANVGICGEI